MKNDISNIMNGPWAPPPPAEPRSNTEQVRDAMIQAGITPPESFVFDGLMHRFPTNDNPGDTSGYYVLFDDGIAAGMFGDWRSGTQQNWCADRGRQLSIHEELTRKAHIESARQRAKEAREKRAETAAETVADIWASCSQASDNHPYLQKKGVKAHGIRTSGDGRLILPLYGDDGKLSSAQYISADGAKLYHTGGTTKGKYFVLGDTEGSEEIIIAEGYATAATIYEETKIPTVVAYSASNLVSVTGSIREMYPEKQITICADNDSGGVGENYASQAAAKHGARVVMPPPGDANDYRQAGGDVKALFERQAKDEWLVPIGEFCAKPEPIQWFIKDWIQSEALVMVHGPSGSGKTFWVLDAVLHMAAQKELWHGIPTKPACFAYLAGEGHRGLKKRIAGWMNSYGVDPAGLKAYVSKSGTDLDTPEGLAHTMSHLHQMPEKPDIVIVDTLHRFLSGDENKAQDTRAMLYSCSVIMQQFGCTVILVHHTGNSEDAQKRARGSSAWRGALDIEINIEALKNEHKMKASCVKSKDAEEPQDMYFELQQTDVAGWMDEYGNPENTVVIQKTTAPEKENGLTIPKDSFRNAWLASGGGRNGQGQVFLTREAWKKYMIETEGLDEESADRHLRPSGNRRVAKLLKEEILEKSGGKFDTMYVVIDPSFALQF